MTQSKRTSEALELRDYALACVEIMLDLLSSNYFYSSTGSLDLGSRASRDSVHLEVQLLAELSRISQHFDTGSLRALGITERTNGVDVNSRSVFAMLKRRQTNEVEYVLTEGPFARYEPDLWETSVKRHLTSLESRANTTTGTRSLTLTSLTGGFSVTRTLAATYASTQLASASIRL
jgi:hypothetical protein